MPALSRVGIAALAFSAMGLITVALHEGYTDRAVVPVPGDVPTVGFGTTSGVKMGDTTTPERALVRLAEDVGETERAIKRCIHVELHQHEWDAYVSFAYNVGSGAFCRSTLGRLLNERRYEEACAELLKWVYVGKSRVRGLENRRKQEYDKCMGR